MQPASLLETTGTTFRPRHLDLYVSEMSVSDLHGGGITLQRVLGSDLNRIQAFVHLSRFAKDLPASPALLDRCLEMPIWFDRDPWRRVLGERGSSLLSFRRPTRKIYAWAAAAALARRFRQPHGPMRALVCPQGWHSLHLTDALMRRTDLEYVTWVMDDHLVRWKNGNWWYPPGIEELFGRHLSAAKSVFVISPSMQERYSRHFGVKSRVLFGPAAAQGSPVWESEGRHDRVRLAYFGALTSWQVNALKLLCQSLGAAGAVLDIYADAANAPAEMRLPLVTFKERIPANAVCAAMRNYDAVVLPVSFDAADRNMSEFNIATKMSECLASGTITLVIAPPYAIMARLLEGRRAAVVVTGQNAEAIVDAISRVCDPIQRRGILKAAGEFVSTDLSAAAMRKVWEDGTSFLAAR